MISRRDFVAAAAGLPVLTLTGWNTVCAEILEQEKPKSLAPWLEIDASALAHNVRTISALAGGRPIIAVVKNNAYGLGLATAGPLLASMNEIHTLAVVRADEALTLRNAGVRKPILLMGPATEDELVELVRLDVAQSPYRDGAPAILARVAERAGRAVRVHLYVDTGMHRMGMPVAQALPWLESLSKTSGIRIEGAFTELTEDADFDRQQVVRLRELQAAARARGIAIGTLHAASSDAIQRSNPGTFLDAVRPGLAIYGGYVSADAMERGGLRPTYRLKTRVLRLDHLAAGEGISYHRRWIADRPTWTATLAVGHVDGYPSGATKGCEVLAAGKLYPVIGTVSASHTVIQLGDDRTLNVGDEVTLVGGENPALHPNEVAKRSGWSEYNMFMHLSPTLARIVTTGLLLLASIAWAPTPLLAQAGRPLLAVFAHPDDERVIGPLLSRLAREGRDTHLVIATDGSKGVREHAGVAAGKPLAAARRLESECAARQLGVRQLHLLGLPDGELASFGNLGRLRAALDTIIARTQPAVIITFGPEGGTGHPDHRLVGNVTTQIVQSDDRHSMLELLYASLPTERLRTAPRASPIVNGMAEALLTVRVPFENQDLVAGRESFACHKTQYTSTEMQAINAYLAHAWNGNVYLRPWLGTMRDQATIFGR
jgi:alanine racemase